MVRNYAMTASMSLQNPPSKQTLKLVFLTLFLDLIGFSIIFPLFPDLIQYYLRVDAQNPILQAILSFAASLANNHPETIPVLFGGILASLYSLFQFVFAPIFGKWSDQIGRKPILIISIFGLTISYGFWFFAKSFTILLLGRLIGGLMSGNISTATAIIGDTTTESNRAKGMAVIGIAFGLGFIFGPAIGGLSSLVRLDQLWPQLTFLNPFSFTALVALILSAINLVSVVLFFRESLPKEKRGTSELKRSANVLRLFSLLPFAGTNLTNFANFFFLVAFAGMEFTLTFLAHDRFNYSPRDNAMMFVFTGLWIALIQGGFVRRKAHQVGEKNMVLLGFLLLAPGFILIGLSNSGFILYLGLFFMAIGSALIIPCLTALASLYAPAVAQGQTLGVFRSLGALARVVGPIVTCFAYWRFGSHLPYLGGALFLLIPLLLVWRLPQLKKT